jgi:hypothetical protein
MRVSLAALLIFAFIVPMFGQEVRSGRIDNNMKGSPFSAEAVSESEQTLADGNKIVRKSVTRIFRDSEGRYRREEMPRQLGVAGAVVDIPESIAITDPVAGMRYNVNPKDQSYRESSFKSDAQRAAEREAQMKQREAERQQREAQRQQRQADAAKRQADRANQPSYIELGKKNSDAAQKVEVQNEVRREVDRQVTVRVNSDIRVNINNNEQKDDPNCKTESLGTQNIEGVMAQGTRTTTIIPAGKIGNEQPIEVVYEKWYSPELQMNVYTKLSDPRIGVQTYRLTNINRSEQPINLFQPPQGYRPVSDASPKPLPVLKPVPAVKPVPGKPAEIKKTQAVTTVKT